MSGADEMERPSTLVVIGVDKFEVPEHVASKTWDLQADLWPAVAGVLAELGSLAALSDFGAQDAALMGRAAQAFFRALPREKFGPLTRELLEGLTLNGKALFLLGREEGQPFDLKMQGRTLDTWRLLWRTIQVNYWDFFAALAGGAKQPPVESPSAE